LKANTDIRDEIEAAIRRGEDDTAPPDEQGETADAPALN
jgi:hypothetical protein